MSLGPNPTYLDARSSAWVLAHAPIINAGTAASISAPKAVAKNKCWLEWRRRYTGTLDLLRTCPEHIHRKQVSNLPVFPLRIKSRVRQTIDVASSQHAISSLPLGTIESFLPTGIYTAIDPDYPCFRRDLSDGISTYCIVQVAVAISTFARFCRYTPLSFDPAFCDDNDSNNKRYIPVL